MVSRYVFDEVQENSMEIWKFERYRLIREYDSKPGLVPPFLILEHLYRLMKWFWKKYLRMKRENCKLNTRRYANAFVVILNSEH